jgi:hypothetical protein
MNKTSFIDSYKRVKSNNLDHCWKKCKKEKTKCEGASYHHENKTCYLFKSIKKQSFHNGFTSIKSGNASSGNFFRFFKQ